MTVEELIAELKEYDPKTEVVFEYYDDAYKSATQSSIGSVSLPVPYWYEKPRVVLS